MYRVSMFLHLSEPKVYLPSPIFSVDPFHVVNSLLSYPSCYFLHPQFSRSNNYNNVDQSKQGFAQNWGNMMVSRQSPILLNFLIAIIHTVQLPKFLTMRAGY